ncbi:hypothetical protein FJW10_24725 [Mesorhizobium sp. B4-1-1]|nr:hypothetical protein FJW10_24725 [Mesorhizobium sp. B4-1-1]
MSATAAPPDRNFARRVDQVADGAIEERRIVGAVVVVARRGKILYGRAAGVADREANEPTRSSARPRRYPEAARSAAARRPPRDGGSNDQGCDRRHDGRFPGRAARRDLRLASRMTETTRRRRYRRR